MLRIGATLLKQMTDYIWGFHIQLVVRVRVSFSILPLFWRSETLGCLSAAKAAALKTGLRFPSLIPIAGVNYFLYWSEFVTFLSFIYFSILPHVATYGPRWCFGRKGWEQKCYPSKGWPVSSLFCPGWCEKDCGGKGGSDKNTLDPDDTGKGSTECGRG